MSSKKENPRSVRSRFTPRVRQQSLIEGESMAQQQFKDETNVNNIMDKYGRGVTPQIGEPKSNRQPIFGDFRSMDFQTMINQIADVEGEFSTLPPKVRRRFKNNPYQLLRFLEDPDNKAEALAMGLIEPKEPPKDEFKDEFEPEGDNLGTGGKKPQKSSKSPPKKEPDGD